MSNTNRGRAPSALTIHKLCARAAGRCQFCGCNKYLFIDEITQEELNNTNIAHIVASSPDGPRGDAIRSHLISDSIDNLMLMCLDHHKLIDSDPGKYTEAVLLKMKQEQELAVREACDLLYKPSTEIVRFTSPIKGNVEVDIPFEKAVGAVKNNRKLESYRGIRINMKSALDYRSPEYWREVSKQLEREFDYKIRGELYDRPDLHLSIFPIAPIPLIIKLGNMLGDKVQADIFQKTRVPDTWEWCEEQKTNTFEVEKKIQNASQKRIAIVMSLTAEIALKRVEEVYDFDVAYIIKAKQVGVDSIKSIEDLSGFWHEYQRVCDEIRNQYGRECHVAIFPAIPISAAFEIGRRYMPKVYPELTIYDEYDGFFETLTIGG